ncbi:MAG: hypothetical protein EP299_08330 [Acidobacteria bacterium]|nr:MAG: hypothetical protein EP299_08330 [Acidobacteriota bacterium]
MLKSTLIVLLITACLASPLPVDAQERREEKPQSTAEIIERILELRREMEALLEVLPPELQQEIERRWQEIKEAEAARAARLEPQIESTGRAAVAVVPQIPAPEPTAAFEPRPESTAQGDVSLLPPASPVEPEPTPELTPAIEPSATTTAIVPEPPAPEPSTPDSPPEPATIPVCGTLTPFDSNEDGVLSGADRYWRYFRLELEGGGAGLENQGPASLYDLGIRTIDVELGSYSTADKERGDIDVDEAIHIELVGKGRLAGESGVLVIDADRLARGGKVQLVDGPGTPLAGFQALRPGLALETTDGSRLPLLCP